MAKKKLTDEQYDLRDVMATLQGRGVLCRLLETMFYWADASDDDPIVMARNNGARRPALALAEQLERDFPEQWLQLLRERIARHNHNVTRDDDDGDTSDSNE